MSNSPHDVSDWSGPKAETKVLTALGQSLRKRRKALGLSARQLGARSAVPTAQIAQLEFGIWDIDLLSLNALSESLDTTTADLFEQIEKLAKRPIDIRINQ